MRVVTALAPSHWAPFLINGDASGLEAADLAAANAWVSREGLGMPVSAEDAGFYRFHDALPEMPRAADCQSYVFLIDDKPE